MIPNLQSVTTPDGRSYSFGYGPWGNLNHVRAPGGAETYFDYGTDSDTVPLQPAGWVGLRCPDNFDKLSKRRVLTKRVYPNGGTAGEHRVDYLDTIADTPLTSPTNAKQCEAIRWREEVFYAADLATPLVRKRTGLCAFPSAGVGSSGPGIEGTLFASETRDGDGTVLEGHYYGNTGAFADSSPRGTVFMDFEYATGPNVAGWSVLDMRTTKIVHYQEGVYSSEIMAYGDISSILASGGYRNFGNITSTAIYPNTTATGGPLVTTKYCTDPGCASPGYFHPQWYLARNLIRLPQVVQTVDPTYGVLAQASYAYDEFPTPSNGRFGLDTSMGTVRGNPTTTTVYELTGQWRTFPTVTQYFNTGDVHVVTDPKGNPTIFNVDGRRCTDAATLTPSTSNALGQVTSKVIECFTGNVLSSVDENYQQTTFRYDDIGRITAMRKPGDPGDSETSEYYLLGSTKNTNGIAVNSIGQQRALLEHDRPMARNHQRRRRSGQRTVDVRPGKQHRQFPIRWP
jgi:YD repeat-containing protein